MPIDYSILALPKPLSSLVQRHWKRRAAAAKLSAAYAVVDARDGKRCRVTGVPLVADHPDLKRRLARHHLAKRSTHPAERANPDVILTVSEYVHRLMEDSVLIPEGADGATVRAVSQIVRVAWNRRLLPKGAEPFRVQAWRP